MSSERREAAGGEVRVVRRSAPGAALWASAMLILALIIVQVGRIAERPAYADLVSQTGDFTLMTASGGNDDIVLVLDNRSEMLFVYEVKNQKSLEFVARENVRDLFIRAARAN